MLLPNFVKLAMFKVNAAVLSYAKGSTMNCFGGEWKEIKRIYLTARTGTDVCLSLTEEIKYRKQRTPLSSPCEEQGWLSCY